MSGTLAFQSNSNNAWIFNGNNGNLNYNNNRINANGARVFRDSCLADWERYQSAPIPLSVIYIWYGIAKRGKRRTLVQLRFEADYPGHLRVLWVAMNGPIYIPLPSRGFVLEYPTPREVIHPEMLDRIPQTMWCETIRPYAEQRMDPASYSCRVGRGALAAVRQLIHLYQVESCGGKYRCRFIRIDQKSFFLHIYRPMVVDLFREMIDEAFADNIPKRDWMNWLCRILYLSEPAEGFVRDCPIEKWGLLPAHKIAANLPPLTGVEIGNLDAQLAGNVVSALYLAVFREFGYQAFVHYTDDVILVLREERVEQFNRFFLPELRKREAAIGLELNEKKHYNQPTAHGVTAFGYFVKSIPGTGGVVIYPSKRVVNNCRLRLSAYLTRGGDDLYYRLKNKEHLRDTMNSYFGIFRHCEAYDLRKAIAEEILSSDWGDMIEQVDDYKYFRIIPRYTVKAYRTYKNKQLRRFIYNYGKTRTSQAA